MATFFEASFQNGSPVPSPFPNVYPPKNYGSNCYDSAGQPQELRKFEHFSIVSQESTHDDYYNDVEG
ncbi:uncharacterized protein H6S33_007710 [Morchella sextelata]|uniref:uncharacterized protein n=1 Tax=Morchella sextelata TaxID=1174677 RepID=UPI001D045DB5|nr:uncharacterized protein H6S33_007710 [Morchella sextelata]KAH0603388.1 hypothetical protein H6S33_007710 [Morchella sextelata]